jgi:hypothetical protein
MGNYVESDGTQKWHDDKNNLHRIDGPAVILANGRKRWYYRGHWIACNSQEEFERVLNLKAFW